MATTINGIEKEYIFMGTSDIDTCYCCGKQGLKSTIALRNIIADDVVFFGSTCAAKALSFTIGGKKSSVKKAEIEKLFMADFYERLNGFIIELGSIALSSGRSLKWQSNLELFPLSSDEKAELKGHYQRALVLCKKYDLLPENAFWNGRFWNGAFHVAGYKKSFFNFI